MRVAALDLGTNTFILLVAEVSRGQITRVLHDEVRVIRLGQGVHLSRRFHADALVRAEACFLEFSQVIKRLGVTKILACATSAARDVVNKDELVAAGARHGIPIEIISGEREAELTFWGTIPDSLVEPVVIIDVGGGSTEFILGDKTGLIARKSLDIGAVRLTEMFVTAHPVPEQEFLNLTTHIQQQLLAIRQTFPAGIVSRLIAVAGTPTTLAAIDRELPFDAQAIEGYRLPLSRIDYWVKKLTQMSILERQALPGMEPKRADVLVAGSLILMLSCECFNAKDIEVSVRGLRFGVAKFLST
jgi:exopolyphosphatase/guanosine-5'-triphosphate,3'-diphosphate pyrophosphatase